MNKICRRFEEEFDGHIRKHNEAVKFDYRFLKSDAEYSYSQYASIKKIYTDYNQRLRNYVIFADHERIDEYEALSEITLMNNEFRKECDIICPNKDVLCNIILDICYTKNSTKKFAWGMCGEEIIHNLLQKNKNIISFPTASDKGDIEYCGDTFLILSKEIEVNKWE